MSVLKDYEVTESRFIAGQHRNVGELVKMTELAAKYYTAPYGSGLKLASTAPAPQPEKVDKKPADKVIKAAG